MLAHIKGSARDFLYPFQDENRTEMGQYGGEMSWEVSYTITKDSLLLRFHPTDRFFTPYRQHAWFLKGRHPLDGVITLFSVNCQSARLSEQLIAFVSI